MTTLAPKLPYNHQFAGGYPRVGGQPTPTDPDCLDYLSRLSAADGAGVEVGVAMAIQSFIQGCKADSAGYAGDPSRSNWDAIQAACIMCGARTLPGALVPLKGPAPTNVANNFASGDYSRGGATPGLKGNGVDKYIDSNFNVSSPYLNDVHLGAYLTVDPGASFKSVIGAYEVSVPSSLHISARTTGITANVNNTLTTSATDTDGVGFVGVARSDSSVANARAGGTTYAEPDASSGVSGLNAFVFARNNSGTPATSDVRLAFYSLGSALDLSLLDARVTALVRGIQFAQYTGLSPADYDDATVAYIVAGYIAGGAL